MIKVIDIVSNKTGEVFGYFKKVENEVTWTWIMYNHKCEPVVLDKLPTYKICDCTRNVRATEEREIELYYRLLPNYAKV